MTDETETPAPAEPAAAPGSSLVERDHTTHHERADGLAWSATAGTWVLRDRPGTAKCSISYVAYLLDGTEARSRPVTFVFNGGPGSSSMWLHLGLFGPRRIDCGDGLTMGTPPYELVDNEHSLLGVSDLVFVDPVGTGYSAAAPGVDKKELYGLDEDVAWVGEFIRMWLTRNGRWASPKFLAGESYGTTRAAALAQHLGDEHHFGLDGVILISTVLVFQSLYPALGNDLPYVLALPTLAATAWYHGRTDPSAGDLEAVVKAAEELATGDYARHLLREGETTPKESAALARRLSKLLGLTPDELIRNRLRLSKDRFCKALLRDDGLVVGHFDGRITGRDHDAAAPGVTVDPGFATIRWPFTETYLDYLHAELGVEVDERYVVLDSTLGEDWAWGDAAKGPRYAEVGTHLREALLRDTRLHVFMGNGYYDFATPFYAAEWSLRQLGLPPELQDRITTRRYSGGHMMYTENASLAGLAADIAAFVAG